MKRITAFNPKPWVILLFAAGIAYLLALQLLVSDGAYFSGDGGLNSLLTQNLASGNFGFDVRFDGPPWAKALWDQGLFPYHEPYLYHLGGKYYITFPYTFPLVNAGFFALLGYRGLYVIPGLAALGIWIIFYLFCKKLELKPVPVLIGMLFLIFAANLSLYSAIFWEHTLAVFLSFTGVYCLVPKKGAGGIRLSSALWGGILCGLAVWFRPEEVFVVIFLGLIWLAAQIRTWIPGWSNSLSLGKIFTAAGRHGWIFLAASALTMGLYGATNWFIYGNFLGVHAIQVIGQVPLSARLAAFAGNLRLLTVGEYSLFATVPLAFLVLAYLAAVWIRPGLFAYEKAWTFPYIFSAFFILGVAVLVPAGAGGKQWGPRFLLFLVPVLGLLFSWQLDRLLRVPFRSMGTAGRLALGIAALAALVGIIQNPIRGGEFLRGIYAQAGSAAAELRRQGEPVIAISDQFLGQQFQPALSQNTLFFEAAKEEQLSRLSDALAAQNIQRFSYACFSFDCKLLKPGQKSKQVERNGLEYNLNIISSRVYGIYTIFDIELSRL